jgi:hypothetical protein
VTRATHPERCGSTDTYEEVTPRTLTWDCTNEECDQSKGKPNLKTWWEKQQEIQRQQLEELLSEQLGDNDGT